MQKIFAPKSSVIFLSTLLILLMIRIVQTDLHHAEITEQYKKQNEILVELNKINYEQISVKDKIIELKEQQIELKNQRIAQLESFIHQAQTKSTNQN
ncbi:hypothetical protein A616_17465 [Brevibacillus brevis X23]|nr:hypothetical protein A616_17465 [Brevibacillus brevis X23]